jgi:predicted membrane protein
MRRDLCTLSCRGALFSICVWILGIISIIGFQSSMFPFVAYIIIVFLLTVYYYLYANKGGLSSNENEILYFALWMHLQYCTYIVAHPAG